MEIQQEFPKRPRRDVPTTPEALVFQISGKTVLNAMLMKIQNLVLPTPLLPRHWHMIGWEGGREVTSPKSLSLSLSFRRNTYLQRANCK